MRWRRMPIEAESPEQLGYERIRNNLAESSVRDVRLGDLPIDPAELAALVLQYADHAGAPGLRGAIGEDWGVGAEDVLVTPGAANALFLLHAALLEPGAELVVVRPNYATNLETPRALGADVRIVDLSFDDGWRIDPARIAAQVTRRTRLISITDPHNPSGVTLAEADLHALVTIAEAVGATLLVDETYRDLRVGPAPRVAATLSPRVVSVSSLSKAYGIPGVRIGWLATRDADLRRQLLAVKEQVVLTGSVLDEAVAEAVSRHRSTLLPPIRKAVSAARATVTAWMEGEELLEWVEPGGGVVCFPRMHAGVDPAEFERVLFERYGTLVGPGRWFEQDPRFFRLGFGWPTPGELDAGLRGISAALREAWRGDGGHAQRMGMP